jgi:hypothetical protein
VLGCPFDSKKKDDRNGNDPDEENESNSATADRLESVPHAVLLEDVTVTP